MLDDVQVTNPCSLQRRADNQPHILVAEANGFAPLRRTVHFESDLTIVLALAPLPAVAAASPIAATPSPDPTAAQTQKAVSTRSVRSVSAKSRRSEPAPAAQETTRSDCDPPYTLDEAGIKVYKTGCL
jgi:hypothetical protein